MKRFSVVFCLVCFGVLCVGAGVVRGQSDGSIVGWGDQVVVAQSALDSLVAVATGGIHCLGLKSDGTIVAWGDNYYGQCVVPAPNSDFMAVAAGGHSLGLKSNGTIVAWGPNGYGQCVVPAPNSDFMAVAAGGGHSLGLKSNGTIVAWGWNDYGQCDVPAPNSDFVAVVACQFHSLGLKSDGTIVAWGLNDYGQCDVPAPNTGFAAVRGGRYHSLGLKSNGTIVAWGDNYYGQCNIPAPNSNFLAIAAGYAHNLGLKSDGTIVAWGLGHHGTCNVPTPNADFVAVAACLYHSLGLKSNGTVVAWGRNDDGQCNVPGQNTDFVAVAAGNEHKLGVKYDGTIVAWGDNGSGQCNVPAPNAGFVAVAAGTAHTLGLKYDGTITAWGANNYFQCIVPAPNADFVAVAAGYVHSLGLKSDGMIAAWGSNISGECNVPAPNASFVAVAAGGSHSLGLKSNGTIVAWGWNDYGQCDVPAPNADFVAVAARRNHNLGLKSNGTIVAWGSNSYGECNIPAPNADFVTVATGDYHSLGLKSDGTIVAWGWNNYGQCNVLAPNGDFVAIAGGDIYSLGLKSSAAIPGLVWNTNDSGVGSLRLAIVNANAAPDTSMITFAIEGAGPHTIQPLTPLPIITAPVIIDGYTQPGASANTNGDGLGGNAVLKIELDGSALSSISDRGLEISTGDGSAVRGLVINSFPGIGIFIRSDSNVIEGNYVGTDVTGSLARPNYRGLDLGGRNNIIGGTEPASRNVISGNTTDGISMGYSSSNLIQGNFIGVSASGALGVANNANGVRLTTYADSNVVYNNVVSANALIGVLVSATAGGGGNSITRNYVGTDVAGTVPLGNGSDGVRISVGSMSGADITVGGGASSANLIANNGGDGVNIALPAAGTLRATVRWNTIHSNDNGVVVTQGNATLSQNNIFSNAGLGIDLADDGLTANDTGDSDTGPNGLQNYPQLVAVDPESRTVTGTLNSTPSTEIDIEFFSSASCDPSGFGEGAKHVGKTRVTTNAEGNVTFEKTLPVPIPGGHYITATARPVSGGGTSEFSACFEVINTPVGTNVSVTPVDEATGETPVALTFDEVTAAGNTLLEISDTGPAVPGTFIVGDSAMYCHLSTTATFNDSILVCLSYDQAEIPGAEEDLVILHYDTSLVSPDWVDITVSLDTLANVVCGKTATLSPFVLAVPASGTAVDQTPELPAGYALYQNVPNPFNPVTTLRFDLPVRSHVKLGIYNVKGQLVCMLLDRDIDAGRREARWDGKDSMGRGVASGIYFYRLQTPAFSESKKMILLR